MINATNAIKAQKIAGVKKENGIVTLIIAIGKRIVMIVIKMITIVIRMITIVIIRIKIVV